ncbi:hypothetical protein HBA54_03240 [Pelagibius litoralis]|uniref:Transcriptional coactivator p15 (PC4) C-terminal domain-containing protein n=1 Tax=Pelagibius litoralis TaxID=374515 RepID=A0A967C757_9PROT|nr:transcriptional coactivator p15/PC4 family protein [Pelagibius litoralis]NIA67597.1 hypothetical protein [Pelagibius litoralis]
MTESMCEIGAIGKNKREELLVTIGEIHGHRVVDVRIRFENDEGEMIATKKGVNLRIEALPGLIELLEDAQAQAMLRGWVDSPTEAERDAA